MREIIEVVRCDVHTTELADAESERFKFFWPRDGKTYEVDLCKQCGDNIEAMLMPFMRARRGESGNSIGVDVDSVRPPRQPDQRRHAAPPLFEAPANAPLPRGHEWASTVNGGGDIRNHATVDRVGSVCGYIGGSALGASKSTFVGDRAEGAPYCRKCVQKLQTLERQRKSVKRVTRTVRPTGKQGKADGNARKRVQAQRGATQGGSGHAGVLSPQAPHLGSVRS